MRILLAHQGHPPESTGGSELYTAALARRLARDHDVVVLHRSADPVRSDHDLRAFQDGGLRRLSFNNLHRETPGFEAYRDGRAGDVLARVLDEERPDVLHVQHLNGLSTRLVFEARRRAIPVAFTLHDFSTLCPLGQLLNLRLEVCPGPTPRRCLGCVGEQVNAAPPSAVRAARQIPFAAVAGRALARVSGAGQDRIGRRLDEMHAVLGAADVLISPSRFLADRFAALGVPGIVVLENGHDPIPALAKVEDPESRLRIGFIGAAIPSKGVHVLADAFRQLADPRATLAIHGAFVPYHGDHGYEGRVRAILGPHAPQAVRGPFAPADLPAILAHLDVLVVPSVWEENAPLVVQEAFLARLPLVVSDHGGLAERVRHEVDGLRFRPGDPADLARALRRLIDDPVLRRRLGTTPPPVPDMDRHVGALERLYEQAIERSRTRTGRVGVVVLDSGRPEDTARAVRSALDATLDLATLVVENGSPPVPGLPAGTDVVRLPRNVGYAAGMNAGIARLRAHGCDRILLLNNDAVLEPGCVRRLAEALEDRRVAAVAPVILREADGRIESAGARFDPRSGRFRLLSHGEGAEAREGVVAVPALSGAAWMLGAAALDAVGPLEESYFWSFEDTEWCVRARRAGFTLQVLLGARARHGGSRTLGADSPERHYYVARNHLWAAARLLPLAGLSRWLRSAAIVALNLAHAVRQGQVRRTSAIRAVLDGAADFHRGRSGPRVRAS